MILNVSHINKSFGSDDIIRDASFLINEHEKVAIVGINGAGKTTLLRILTHELELDSGEVVLAKNSKIGYLHQINDMDSTLSIIEELYTVIQPIIDMEEQLLKIQEEMKHAGEGTLSALYEKYNNLTHAYEMADGYKARSMVNGVLKGLGFDESEFNKPIHTLSGGQKTRLFLGKLLIEKPDIIILDEPTNHLDLNSIEWLETYLMNYPGAVIIVSHDRYFLDRIVSKVIDIDQGEVSTYTGNYSSYADKKASIREAKLKAYLNQQQEIKHQEAVIEKLKSFNREKSIKRAESREKMLDKVTRLEKPKEVDADMKLYFSQTVISGQDVLNVDSISKSFDDNLLFKDVSFEVKRGEHVAIIGNNGTGKTTILKIINGLLSPDTGHVDLGSGVMIAYYDQEHQVLHMEKNIFEEISDAYPDLDNTTIRNILAAFLFTGDDVFKSISDLSGGERGRVSLAKLMLSKANLLLLDEPTNHLDIESKEVLERAVQSFEGTVLYVSHDRYFINKTATRIMDLTKSKLLNYIGNYDYYLEKKETIEQIHTEEQADTIVPATSSSAKDDWKTAKEAQAKLKKARNALNKCEESIHELETKIAVIDKEFENPDNQTDVAKLTSLQKDRDKYNAELEDLYRSWEKLAEEANDE